MCECAQRRSLPSIIQVYLTEFSYDASSIGRTSVTCTDTNMLLSLAMLMLSATQIYTIFTVQLLAVLNPLPVEANIVAVSVTVQYYVTCVISDKSLIPEPSLSF